MIGPVRPKLARDIAERKFSEFFRVWSAPTHETLAIVEEHWTKGVLRNEITKLRASLSDLTDEARTNYLLQRAATLEQWRNLIPSLQELHKQWTGSRLEGEEDVESASRPA
ncbi:hypothetical protein PsYK624_071380 [Phanerochaete sordida]|uniref:Uncharacterized protein n=1 Tax=Phanerochaete sordida TaxID=48140 RepID=A0A9P3GA28_9APHY|nr:hypothetical protein PsYK624_071380 [Phanerochaete sordida]